MPKPVSHMHGCPTCRDTYLCVCRVAYSDDPPCSRCVGGHERTDIHYGRLPRPCCLLPTTRPARKDEAVLYRLAGTRPWWICVTCKRAFTYKPQVRVDLGPDERGQR